MRSPVDTIRDMGAGLGYALSRPHFIVILGMHRSGTSCVSRTLNLMGASIGLREHSRLRAPDGEIHWEPSSLIWINDEILGRSGGSWDRPPNHLEPSRRDFLRCRRFLWEYRGNRLAVFKDPRLCLTYGVWKEVLPDHTVVISLRHPMNVARSLERRDGMDISQGLALWTHYNQRILEALDEFPKAFWFDFDRGRPALLKLAEDLVVDLDLRLSGEAIEHYDPDAHRFHGSPDLPAETEAVYREMLTRLPAI